MFQNFQVMDGESPSFAETKGVVGLHLAVSNHLSDQMHRPDL